MSPSPWTKDTSDRWFLGLFAVATVLTAYLLAPFLYVLAAAASVVVVSWPVYAKLRVRLGGRDFAAALLTCALLFLLILGPLASVLYLSVGEAVTLGQAGVEWFQGEGFQAFLGQAQDISAHPWVVQLIQWLPEGASEALTQLDIANSVLGPIQNGALSVLNRISAAVPNLISGTVAAGVDALMFVLATFTFYLEGPRLLAFVKKLSPIDDAYEDRLFAVFAEFANNMVVASVVTATAQGFVAALGYSIAGMERVIVLGILTAIFSFIPMVGTGLIWVPVMIAVGIESGVGWAAFVAIWSIGFTGTVDNLLKPMLLRGGVDIHPLLVLLAVFGGMAWLDLPGALVGPLVVSLFLAMYTIYCEDFLGEPRHDLVPAAPGWSARARVWWAAKTSPAPPAPSPSAEPSDPAPSEGSISPTDP